MRILIFLVLFIANIAQNYTGNRRCLRRKKGTCPTFLASTSPRHLPTLTGQAQEDHCDSEPTPLERFVEFLATLRTAMPSKPDPWRCRFCMRLVSGKSGQCGGCWRYWVQCHDNTFVPQQQRQAPRTRLYGWLDATWMGSKSIWPNQRAKSRPRTQSPRHRQNRP